MLFDIEIEPKEDETGSGVQPGMPASGEAAARLRDILADVTKHDDMTGWRVTRVTPA